MNLRRQEQARLRLAQEAARLMVDESIDDYRWAREKAAQRLGVHDKRCLPRNEEIDLAAAEYARLFAADEHQERLARLRKIALEAMEFLQAFHPCLIGGAASGTVGEHTPILLELYADTPELVLKRLREAGIPFTEGDFQVYGKTPAATRTCPKITFLVNEVPVELLVFPSAARAHPTGGRELPRLSLKQLRRLLAQ
ncbi:MAG: hypothetical protein EPN21_06120 [Methylococcaceae bacterium]|nr:MAG: hypothetical protein EPN21_06120 [Methylococcaceae bacterium]